MKRIWSIIELTFVTFMMLSVIASFIFKNNEDYAWLVICGVIGIWATFIIGYMEIWTLIIKNWIKVFKGDKKNV